MSDLMIDFETIGQDVLRCPIVNCSFFMFDVDRFMAKVPYTYDEILGNTLRLKLSVEKQVANGYKFKPGDLDFWDSLGDAAKKQLIPQKNDLTYAEFCDKMLEWMGNKRVDYWWSRSNTFDPLLLWRIFEDSGKSPELNNKLKFWKIRDVRTYIDAKTDFSLTRNGFVPIDQNEWNRKFIPHDSRHDVTGDVLRLQCLVRTEQGLN